MTFCSRTNNVTNNVSTVVYSKQMITSVINNISVINVDKNMATDHY